MDDKTHAVGSGFDQRAVVVFLRPWGTKYDRIASQQSSTQGTRRHEKGPQENEMFGTFVGNYTPRTKQYGVRR